MKGPACVYTAQARAPAPAPAPDGATVALRLTERAICEICGVVHCEPSDPAGGAASGSTKSKVQKHGLLLLHATTHAVRSAGGLKRSDNRLAASLLCKDLDQVAPNNRSKSPSRKRQSCLYYCGSERLVSPRLQEPVLSLLQLCCSLRHWEQPPAQHRTAQHSKAQHVTVARWRAQSL